MIINDNRRFLAVCHYLTLKCCKKVNDTYQPLQYEHLNWLLAQTFYLISVKYGFNWFDDTLLYFSDEPFIPSAFNADWEAEYARLKTGGYKTRKGKIVVKSINKDVDYTYFLSESDIICMNRAILKYKMYAKFVLNLSFILYNVKNYVLQLKEKVYKHLNIDKKE